MRDIHFLELFRNLDLTGEQRKQAAEAIKAFEDRRDAILKLAHPDELVAALGVVREALLRGEQPTDEMREAVEVARPPDDGSIDQEFMRARTEVIDKLEATLTEEQRNELIMLPLVEVARDMVYMPSGVMRLRFDEDVAVELGPDRALPAPCVTAITGAPRPMVHESSRGVFWLGNGEVCVTSFLSSIL